MAKKKKVKINEKGYLEEEPEFSNLIHRRIAYEHIYKKNRDKYPLQFKKYVVHHIDGKKLNNDVSNLELLTKEDHNKVHERIKEIGRHLTREEIQEYLNVLRGQEKLPSDEEIEGLQEEAGEKNKEPKGTVTLKPQSPKKNNKIYGAVFLIVILAVVGYSLANFNELFDSSIPEEWKAEHPGNLTDNEARELCRFVCGDKLNSVANNINHDFVECVCRYDDGYETINIDYTTKERLSKEEIERRIKIWKQSN